jgi:hypothetical protein
MMEYKIANKVNKFLHGAQMHTVLVYTDLGQVIHIIKEFDTSTNWHRKVVSIGIADAEFPEKITKASFDSKDKIEQVIKLLQNSISHFE